MAEPTAMLRDLIRSLPVRSASGLPVYVAASPAAPFSTLLGMTAMRWPLMPDDISLTCPRWKVPLPLKEVRTSGGVFYGSGGIAGIITFYAVNFPRMRLAFLMW